MNREQDLISRRACRCRKKSIYILCAFARGYNIPYAKPVDDAIGGAGSGHSAIVDLGYHIYKNATPFFLPTLRT